MRPFLFITLAVPCAVFAAPAQQNRNRQKLAATVLKFADVLNQFEAQFYEAALTKFVNNDFVNAGFISNQIPLEQFIKIQKDEVTHSSFLQSGIASIGEKPVTSCKFKLDAATKDVATMTTTARILENLGVAAFLGAAPFIRDPVILQAAASILTVEARHQTMLNVLSSNGSTIPNPFDVALSPSEVLAIASPFFDGRCDLGIAAFPTLTITNKGPITPGTTLTFKADAMRGGRRKNQQQLFCQMLVGGMPNTLAMPVDNCIVPPNFNGPVTVWVTSNSQPLPSNSLQRDKSNKRLVAGPQMTFVDTQTQTLVQKVRGLGPGNVTNNTVVTGGGAGSGSGNGTTTSESPNKTASAPPAGNATTTSNSPGGTASSPPQNNGLSSGGPVLTTGASADGKLNVLGWNVTDTQGQ
ncbi:hypothetical protein L218DRAFT_995114 [Marasmius fiardii PR-910]|nr:hypothetical protein L218DRAFT_995114 [Marasmius fiardii PR-910]